MNRLTLMTIQNRGEDIVCAAGGPSTEAGPGQGKYAAWITLYNDGEYDHELLSTEAVFASAEDAKKWARSLVEAIRKMPDVPICNEISPEDLKVVQEVLNLAHR